MSDGVWGVIISEDLGCAIFYWEIKVMPMVWSLGEIIKAHKKGTIRGLFLNKFGVKLYGFQMLKGSFYVWLTVKF